MSDTSDVVYVMFLEHLVTILNVSAPLETHYDTKMKNRRVPKQGNYRTDTAFIRQMQNY